MFKAYCEFKKVEELVSEKYLNLVYYDESGFNLTSCIPEAWQEKGNMIAIPASKSKQIDVAGFLSSDGKSFQGYQKEEETMKSIDVIGFFDDFAQLSEQKCH